MYILAFVSSSHRYIEVDSTWRLQRPTYLFFQSLETNPAPRDLCCTPKCARCHEINVRIRYVQNIRFLHEAGREMFVKRSQSADCESEGNDHREGFWVTADHTHVWLRSFSARWILRFHQIALMVRRLVARLTTLVNQGSRANNTCRRDRRRRMTRETLGQRDKGDIEDSTTLDSTCHPTSSPGKVPRSK